MCTWTPPAPGPWQSHPHQQLIHKHHTHPPSAERCGWTLLCYLSVSMAIKVASDNGYFLSTLRFGNFSSITAQTSNSQSCSGSLWLGLWIVRGCEPGEVFLVILSLFLVRLFPRDPQDSVQSQAGFGTGVVCGVGVTAGSCQLTCHLSPPHKQQLT